MVHSKKAWKKCSEMGKHESWLNLLKSLSAHRSLLKQEEQKPATKEWSMHLEEKSKKKPRAFIDTSACRCLLLLTQKEVRWWKEVKASDQSSQAPDISPAELRFKREIWCRNTPYQTQNRESQKNNAEVCWRHIVSGLMQPDASQWFETKHYVLS